MWELNQVACDSTKLNTTLSIYLGTGFLQILNTYVEKASFCL